MRTSIRLCCALFGLVAAVAAAPRAEADALTTGAANYKPFMRSSTSASRLPARRSCQSAVMANDAAGREAAWMESRKGWEAAEPITGEFFSKLDEAINA